MQDLTRIFKALSDKNRIRILKMLETRALCVCEMTAVLGLATSTVSRHLAQLKDAGLIQDEKDGKWVNYTITKGEGPYLSALQPLLATWLTETKEICEDRLTLASADRYQICGLSAEQENGRFAATSKA